MISEDWKASEKGVRVGSGWSNVWWYFALRADAAERAGTGDCVGVCGGNTIADKNGRNTRDL
jgi:hypothetical protein